jgi:dynein heavy chain
MNVLIMGPTGTGKTKLIRNYALKQLKANEFDKKFFNMTGECSASTLKSFVERKLIRMRKQQIMRPKGTSIHLFFVDDLNMCRADKWNIKSTHELMRQWFDHEGWYDLRYHEFTKVKNVQFCANVSLPDESLHSENHLQERFMWHWALVTFVNRNEEHLTEIYKHILGWIIGAWPEDVRGASTTVQITNATLEFYKYFKKNIP